MKLEMVTRFVYALASADMHTTTLLVGLFAFRENLRLPSNYGTFPHANYSKRKKPPHVL